jgi:hypothetical protein
MQSRSRSSVVPQMSVAEGRMQSAEVTHAAAPPSAPTWGTWTGHGRVQAASRHAAERIHTRIASAA